MIALFLPIGSTAYAATVPTGFTDSTVASGLSNPTAMAFAPDGRIFVTQQGGSLRVIKNGALLATPFLTVTVNSSGERGLLGVAFDPDFANNQFVYVYYTATSPSVHNRISRFTASGDVAAAGSENIILELDNLSSATNHNGGAIHFGIDGKLYAAAGDNANSANAQTFANLHGKMLRINKDGTIPTDNPFYSTATGNNRGIWALGLRNPFTFSFQRGVGRMFINDVGQGAWEEVNDGIAGSNYGWSFCEGNCSPSDARFRDPLYAYANAGSACAITGGAFYNPQITQFPTAYVGDYFFADFCAGWIRKLDPPNYNAFTEFATGIANPVDLQVSADGSLYYLARGAGSVGRIQFPPAAASGIEGDISPRPNDPENPNPGQLGDGAVNSGDVTQIRRYILGIDTPDTAATNEFQRADTALFETRGDGEINSGDLTQIRRYALNVETPQNAAGPNVPNLPPSFAEKSGGLAETGNLAPATTRTLTVVRTSLVGNTLTVGLVLNTDGSKAGANALNADINYDPAVLSNPTNIQTVPGSP
ncbi:MAG: PQQ-dependent sugar dehydrogenase, partial [Pyrinomonadaceae bacterium]